MKIKEGGGMDLQEEREAFQKFCEENFDFERHEQTYFDEQTQCYENDIGEDTESINMAWSAWQAKAQAVPRWISVKNAMPKAGSQVLTYDDYGFVSVENIDGCEDPNNVYFSHWLPLPPVEQEPAND